MRVVSPRIQSQSNKPAELPGSTSSAPDCQAIFQNIAKNCIDLIRDHRKTTVATDSEAIHSMRIELMRLRATILFFSPMTYDNVWPKINKELRWLNSALGKARNHDVTENYAWRKRYRRWAKSSQQAMLRAQRKVDRRLEKKLASDRCIRLIIMVDHWITDGPWLQIGQSIRSGHVDAYAQARLLAWRKVISRDGRCVRALHHKQLHRLRIRCKRYRYIVEILHSLGITIARQELKFAEIAKQAHGALGDFRDLKRLRRVVQKRPPGYRRNKRKLLQQTEKLFRHKL